MRGIFGREAYMWGVLIFSYTRDAKWVTYFGGEESYIRGRINRVSQYINWLIANIRQTTLRLGTIISIGTIIKNPDVIKLSRLVLLQYHLFSNTIRLKNCVIRLSRPVFCYLILFPNAIKLNKYVKNFFQKFLLC